MPLLLRSVVVLLLLSSISFGRDIYVHGRLGDNRYGGYSAQRVGTDDGPVRTISRALELARGGDRIVIDPEGGPYREAISLIGRAHGGGYDLPFIIEGQGAVLDGTEAVLPGIWRHYRDDVYRFQLTMQPSNWTHFALYDRDEMLSRIAVGPDATAIPELEPNTWCLFRGTVFFRAEAGRSPLFETDYELSYSARQVGVSLIQVQDVRIHDLQVQGFQLDGISAANGARNVILDSVVSRQNGRSGLAVGGASTVSAGYCTFSENQSTQVLSQPFSRLKLYGCEVDEDGITQTTEDSEVSVE